jgi:hypothetical protein
METITGIVPILILFLSGIFNLLAGTIFLLSMRETSSDQKIL